ncbi:MAG: hypothetical protein IPM29_22150 [Planctomycetes bacterium]|nr:hypothetical protein [Planctomycetota bacterium]
MNRWGLLAVVVLLVAGFAVATGVSASRDRSEPAPERAPDWIEGGLGGLLLPFAERLAPSAIAAQQGAGWSYDPGSARLRFDASDQLTTAALRLPRDPDPDAGDDDVRALTLRVVQAVGGPTDALVARLVVDGDEDFATLRDGRLNLAVPRDGAILELRCRGPRTLRLE